MLGGVGRGLFVRVRAFPVLKFPLRRSGNFADPHGGFRPYRGFELGNFAGWIGAISRWAALDVGRQGQPAA